MAGSIQNDDIKTSAELAAAGADDSYLPNDTKIYVTANTLNKTLNQAITDGDIGGGGSGKNYFSNRTAKGDIVTDFNSYADAAGLLPVDGTGGSPSGSLSLIVTPTALSGSNSIILDKVGSVNLQGQGKSIDFSIDVSDRGQRLAFTMNYKMSTDYADDDVIIYFYDVTNSRLVEPTPYKIKKHLLNSDRFFAEVQVPYDCATLRLIFHVASTSTQNYFLTIDDLTFGPMAKLYGSPVTDWKSFTVTSTWGGSVTCTGKYRIVGDTLFGKVRAVLLGAAPGGNLSFRLPTGFTINTNKVLTTSTTTSNIGIGVALDSGVNNYPLGVWYENTTQVTPFKSNASGSYAAGEYVNASSPFVFNAGDEVNIEFSVPILGLSSSQLMSHDAETRVLVTKYETSAGQVIPTATETVIDYGTKVFDDTGLVTTGSGWKFTAKTAGTYRVSAFSMYDFATWAATAFTQLRIYKNNSSGPVIAVYTADSTQCRASLSGSDTIDLVAGDYIQIKIYQDSGSNKNLTPSGVYNHISIEKISGPAQIMASEKVRAKYVSTAGQSIPSNVSTIVDFGTKVYDTRGAVTTGGSWKFTAPRAGFLKIYSLVGYAAASFSATGDTYLEVFKNGVSVDLIHWYRTQAATAFNMPMLVGQSSMEVIAGDYVHLAVYQNEASARSLHPSASLCKIEIELE